MLPTLERDRPAQRTEDRGTQPAAIESNPRLVRPLTRSRAWLFVALLGIGVGQALAAVGFAALVQRGFDAFLGTGQQAATAATAASAMDVGAWWLFGAGLAVCILATGWLRGTERATSERLGQRYVTEVRAQLFAHLVSVSPRTLGGRNHGELLMKFVGDLSALRLWVARGLARLTVAAVAVGLALTAIAVMNLALAAAVATVLLVGALLMLITTPWMLRTAKRSRRRRSRLTGEVAERLTKVAVVQAAGQVRREQRRVERRGAHVAEAMVDQAKASGFARAVAEGTGVAAIAAALVVGGFEAAAGRTTAGSVVAAVSIAGLLASYLRDIGRVAEYAARAKIARAAARRFLAVPTLPDAPGAPDLRIQDGTVELRDVDLDDALDGVSLRATPGQRIAIVGRNGAGKSTLISVIARLADPDAGAVLIDDQDLREHSLASLRRTVGIASPAMPLLAGSVQRNVTYRQPRVDEEEFARVARLCELDDLVASLPDGWQTQVGPGGNRLSSGQQTRIALARAILGRPEILILDEPEAHLDPKNAEIIERVLDDHRGTALVVTHSRTLVAAADRVWYLEGGQVAADVPTEQFFREHADALGLT